MSSVASLSFGETTANQSVGMGRRVATAIQKASSLSGVDFSYLMAKASQESSFDPNAKAKTSSATGLFQFVDQTWLRVVKNYGDKYGLSSLAGRISIGSDGVARAASEADKKAILALRTNPEISSCMAAELTNENKERLQDRLGGNVGSTELYLAHFLGASGACSFLSQMKANPDATAASVLPSAASANRSVFYDKSGEGRSLKEVYQFFARKFDHSESSVQVASTTSAPSTVSSAASSQVASVSSVSSSVASSVSSSFTGLSSYLPETTMSSPFAAMMIAQMGWGESLSSEDEERRKSASNLLGLAS